MLEGYGFTEITRASKNGLPQIDRIFVRDAAWEAGALRYAARYATRSSPETHPPLGVQVLQVPSTRLPPLERRFFAFAVPTTALEPSVRSRELARRLRRLPPGLPGAHSWKWLVATTWAWFRMAQPVLKARAHHWARPLTQALRQPGPLLTVPRDVFTFAHQTLGIPRPQPEQQNPAAPACGREPAGHQARTHTALARMDLVLLLAKLAVAHADLRDQCRAEAEVHKATEIAKKC